MQLEVVHRARHEGRQPRHKVLGVVLNDGTPVKSVEVKVDDGPWQPATMDPSTNGKYSWKFFNYTWNGADARRAHARLARDGREWTSAADRAGARERRNRSSSTMRSHPRKVMIS